MENIADIKTEMAVGTRWRVADVQGKTDHIIEVVEICTTWFFFVYPEFEGYTEDELYLGFVPPRIEPCLWPQRDGIRDVIIDDAKTFTLTLFGKPISRYTKLDYKSDKKFIKCLPNGKPIFE